MSKPFFSILIPCYNAKDYIERALNSCKNQKFKDFEVILCDNHSDDGIQLLLPKIKMNNFKYFLGKNHVNTIELRNFLIEQANGEYIVWLEAFDELSPQMLSFAFNILKNQNWDILELTTLWKNSTSQFEAKTTYDGEYIDHNCIEIYLKRNDILQDTLWGKVFNAELMKNSLPDSYDIYAAEEAFYSLPLYSNAKSFKILHSNPLYTYYVDIDHFHGLSTFNYENIKTMCEIRHEQLKRNLKLLKEVKYDKSYKLECLDKLYLPNILNDILYLENKEERESAFNKFNEYFIVQMSSKLLNEE